jgi:hypothetical protein
MMRANITIVALLLCAFAAGCERENPGPPDAGPRDAGSREDDAGNLDGGPLTDAGPFDAGPDAGSCEGEDGCWSCAPTTSVHFLNRCTDAICDPFPVTQARLPLLRADGTVPPLP